MYVWSNYRIIKKNKSQDLTTNFFYAWLQKKISTQKMKIEILQRSSFCGMIHLVIGFYKPTDFDQFWRKITMSKYKVSIIMPVYNVEQYLPMCMESLVHQTLKDIEIIAVNDGSPDNSIEILNRYAKDYPDKVKVFTTENRGVSHARNYGLARATGDYILFVDSDDFLEKNMCEILYNKAIQDGNDLVLCGRNNVYENSDGSYQKKPAIILPLSQNFKLVNRKFELTKLSPFPWDKLFKRSLLDGVNFPEGMRFEDLVVAFTVAAKAESIGKVNLPLYNYRRTTQGGFLNSFSKETLDIVTAFDLLFKKMKELNLFETFYEELEYICVRHFFFRYPAFFTETSRGQLDLKLEIINKTQSFLDREVPTWRTNHYLKYSSSKAIKTKLPLYTDKEQLVKLVKEEDSAPSSFKKVCKKIKSISMKLSKKLKNFIKSKKKKQLILKKLKFLKLFNLPATYQYTKFYETCPVEENTILFESKHGDDMAGNIFNMLLELKKDAYRHFKIYFVLKKEKREFYENQMKQYQIDHINLVELRSKEYFKILATAKYLVTDTSFPPYFIKRPEQVYLNTWHGTPLKAMGRIVPSREYGLGNVQRNFLIADYLLFQQDFSRDVFLQDYMIDSIYDGQVLLSGYPRNSSFFRTNRYDEIRKECGLEGKQIIIYMPTWRGLLHKMENKAQVKQLYDYFAQLDALLTDNQIFYVKLHPYVKNGISCDEFLHIKEFPSNYETYDFLNASDMLVTDYSSIMFDYAVSKKKIILFTYDRKEYLDGRGIYVDFDEMDLPKVETVEELVNEINGDTPFYTQFYERFCPYDTADTAKNVCETVFLKKETPIKIENFDSSSTKNVLLYAKVIKDNPLGHDFVKSLNHFANDDKNYFFTFKAAAMKRNSFMLSNLHREIGYFPLLKERNMLVSEKIWSQLALKYGLFSKTYERKIEKFAHRELQKYYGTTSFDRVILYDCTDRLMFEIMRRASKNAIYCFTTFDDKKYQKSKAYRNRIHYILDRLDTFSHVFVPSIMETIPEVTQLKTKTKVFTLPDSPSLETILKEVN